MFVLNKEVSRTTADIDADDVLNTKKELKEMGYYKPDVKTGITQFTDERLFQGIGQLQKDNNLKVDEVMRPKGETEAKINEIKRKAEYASAAAMQGLSFGFADEIEGAMGGLGYGIGAAATKRESPIAAAKRGYVKYRDERRAQLADGYKKAPILTGSAEAVGAIASPFRFVKAASKAAPLGVKAAQNLKDAMIGGAVYGIGASENKPKDYARNISSAVVGSVLGNSMGNRLWGRGANIGNVTGRKIVNELFNQGMSKTSDYFVDKVKR